MVVVTALPPRGTLDRYLMTTKGRDVKLTCTRHHELAQLAHIEFELGPWRVLVTVLDSSGKTNLLAALRFLRMSARTGGRLWRAARNASCSAWRKCLRSRLESAENLLTCTSSSSTRFSDASSKKK